MGSSNMLRVAGYVVVALAMLVARRRERRLVDDADGLWPSFWLVACTLLLAMGVGCLIATVVDIGSLERRLADVGGWYSDRRPLQVIVIGLLATAWCAVVLVALWRFARRGWRYMVVGLLVGTLAGLAAVRIVSLHEVDTVLYRTHVRAVGLGTLIEAVLLVLTGLVATWHRAVE